MSAAESHLERPEFWALHYYDLGLSEERDSAEVITAVFGLSHQELDRYYERIYKPEDEADLVRLPVVAGYDVGVQIVDCGENGQETRYSIGHTDWSEREQLGYESPSFALPAFRWVEVERIARAIAPRSALDAARATLLLFPAVYLTRADDPGAVSRALMQAWSRAGLPERAQAEGLFRNAVENRSVPELTWREDPQLGWINDGDYSFRNPLTLMTAFEPRRFDRVRALMKAVS